jgi:hypothetical protein
VVDHQYLLYNIAAAYGEEICSGTPSNTSNPRAQCIHHPSPSHGTRALSLYLVGPTGQGGSLLQDGERYKILAKDAEHSMPKKKLETSLTSWPM